MDDERTGTAPPWWTGAVAGVVAGLAGLAVAELLAGAVRSLRPPVVVVGDRVVDAVPVGVKNWAIRTFGTSDKVVLGAGVLLVLALVAVGVGVLAVRRGPRAGVVGVAVTAGVGAVASLGRGGHWYSPVTSVVAGVVAAGVLVLLVRRATTVPSGPVDAPVGAPVDARRRFLRTSALLVASSAAVGAAGRWVGERGAAAAERLRIVLPRAVRPLPPVAPGASVDVAGVSPFLTPVDRFYRIDTALVVPRVQVDTWRLKVTGMVARPITLTWDQLLARPMQEVDVTIACVSNEVGGQLVGTARWLGCRLDDLLEEAGVDPRADQVVGRSVDGFTAGFPTALLDGRDALVAVGMNGEPLPARHGFPARLIVPGLYGYVSATKWLSAIELTTFDALQGYWIPRGWAVEAPVKTQSRIDTPRVGRTVTAGRPVPVAGVAWAPTRGISKVEVRVDDGPWRPAVLAEEHAATTWRQWSFAWTPTPGEHRLTVRATDGTGATQPEERTDVAPDGATGWHTVAIRAD